MKLNGHVGQQKRAGVRFFVLKDFFLRINVKERRKNNIKKTHSKQTLFGNPFHGRKPLYISTNTYNLSKTKN
jgi:hypothetical protein